MQHCASRKVAAGVIFCLAMSRILARIARNLTHHWKRGLLAAIASLVVLIVLAGTASPAADDWNVPGTESQEAIDLFRAHTPALAGADATLVFSVEDGKITDAASKAAVTKAIAEVEELPNVASVNDPFGRDAQVSRDGTLAAVDVRYGIERNDVEKEDGEALEEAARTAESAGVDVAPARHRHRRQPAAGGAGRRAHRRRARDHPAHAAVPLARRDGRDAPRRAARRHGRPAAARDPGQAARPARVRRDDRGDARPRRGHRLLAADHRPLPRAGRGGRLRRATRPARRPPPPARRSSPPA